MIQKLIPRICFVPIKGHYGIKHCSRTIHYLLQRQNNVTCLKNAKGYSNLVNENVENTSHLPVMVNEVLEYLEPLSGKTFVDMTFGAGGHSIKILQTSPNVKIFALDRDPVAHEFAHKLSEKYPGQVIPLLGRFSELPQLLCQHKVEKNSIDGFLFDFGCSSMQFDVAQRGFSLSKNGPLDMRMDGFRCPEEPTVADVLERVTEIDLIHILRVYGEEKKAKKIARAIVETRYNFRSLKTTEELATLIESVVNEKRLDRLGRFAHCATKTFQALRIFVNNELNEINYGIIVAASYLKTNGRLVTISFHSLEDTVVKRHISGNIQHFVANRVPLKYADCSKQFSADEIDSIMKSPWKMLHKHVITPTPEEIEENPRSRSAKLRAISKVM
ncbi:PREDICTED: probable methyltransferase-like protein 15 homolog [Dufourea novaeangliae]|uniref:probable methyltransferase-like protein 15 homolog n=1 Tax=Dufourea novaeangliae TaxID=178035 RepID=UPI0007678A1C|nr:PREDICTED: probable methyltransferase-like protein 15 homolog [Dufourea novaeangliae]